MVMGEGEIVSHGWFVAVCAARGGKLATDSKKVWTIIVPSPDGADYSSIKWQHHVQDVYNLFRGLACAATY